MKKHLLSLAVLLVLCSSACALTPEEAETMTDQELEQAWLEENFGSLKENVPLRPQDQKALALSRKYADGRQSPDPVLGPGGAITFTYGTGTPRVICRPLRVTDIQLQEGEKVTGVPYVGDSTNWEVLPSTSGPDDALTIHVIVKPLMPDIATNLMIHTDRRSYVIDLVSTSGKEFTPYVRFSYPEWDRTRAWERLNARLERIAEARAQEPEPLQMQAPAVASAPYKITGKSTLPWYPVAVWDDGVKVYVTFSDALKGQEMPVFQTLRGRTREVANYRPAPDGKGFIIDGLFKRGVLTAGKDTIVIERIQATKPLPPSLSRTDR